jgi:phosphoribosylformylglycinamidine synthase
MSDEEIAGYREETWLCHEQGGPQIRQEYFALEEKRDPTVTELKVIDTYWSDPLQTYDVPDKDQFRFLARRTISGTDQECVPGIFENEGKKYYGGRDKDMSLMDMAVYGAKFLKKKGFWRIWTSRGDQRLQHQSEGGSRRKRGRLARHVLKT